MQGQLFFKGEGGWEGWGKGEGGRGGGLALSLFNFFKVYHFYIYKLLYSLQNCVMHLKKNNFFCHHNFMKKVHAKLSKNEPENIP